MCGIAGFVDFDGRSDRPELEKMTDSLRHRGPDASGYYVDRTDGYAIGLGHRRLSIIDLSPAGNQPMQFQNGRYWIVFNGEIYNYAELKEQLAAKGRHFQSHSDTEVILHAYHEWGPESLSRFVGMFAFVIYDTQERKLFCCRDRAGVKPFFYFWDGKHFLFGSELKAILVNPYAEKRIDNRAIASFLQFGYIPSNQCIFQQTYKLLPGHFLLFDLNRISIHTEQYWSVYSYYNREKLKISLEDAIPETERILSKAFRYRMVADVPVGVFLSGGYDSSCLAALLQKDGAQKLKTFTIGFDDQ
ncbi:MAG TPA: asparagine synthase (glutamine-hydrolyzing), partial [Puia sp.]|nr:asparagine synthase (glutamine-hydrolyzing) [Puia sp.]